MNRLISRSTLILLVFMQSFALPALAKITPSQTSISLAQQMYVAYYGRPGDSAGIEYWAGRFEDSDNLDEVLSAFGDSKEYTDNYGTLSKEALVNGLFLQMFNRSSDDHGLDFYTKRLQSGEATRASIAKQIADGAGFFDKETFDNKVFASNKYTYYATSGITSYTSAEIAAVSKLLSEVTYSEETKNIFLKKVDLWIKTGHPSTDFYCEEILRSVFQGHLKDMTYNELFTEALAYQAQSGWCQAALAYMYQEGKGTGINLSLSLEFAQASANDNNPAGQTILGEKYFVGNGLALDKDAALNYFSSAAAQDYWRGFYSLGRYYFDTASLNEDFAYQYFQRAYQASVNQDYTAGEVRAYLGEMQFFGKGVPQDYEKALSWWYEGAKGGDARSQEWLGYLYETGTYTPMNINQAIYWYQQAADQNIEHMRRKVQQLINILEGNNSGTGDSGNSVDRYTEIPIPDVRPASDIALTPDWTPNISPLQSPGATISTDNSATTNILSDGGISPSSGVDSSSGARTSLNITWNRPLSRSNGDALAREEIAKYTLYYYRQGQGQAQVQVSLDANNIAGNTQLQYTTEPLPAGTYLFSIDCVDINGLHSEKSTLASIQIN